MILVTGATGNVGRELVKQLASANQPIRVFTRDASKVAQLDPKIERAIGDLDNPASISAAVQGVDRIFLVTAATQQDINIVQAAKTAGVKQIVKLSSDEANFPDTLPIGRWNVDREQVIQASGLGWTILRPGSFMSNSLQWVDGVRRQGMVIFPGGKGKISPIDPYDIAGAAAATLTQSGHEGQTYQLTGSDLLTTAEQVQILGQALGKSLRYINPPLFIARIFMRRFGMQADLVDGLLLLAKAASRGDFEYRTETVKQLTGRSPRTFEQWCQDHIAAFQ